MQRARTGDGRRPVSRTPSGEGWAGQLNQTGPLQVLLSDGPLRREAEGHSQCSDPDTPASCYSTCWWNPARIRTALVKAVSVSQPTVSWHLKRLIELGIVQKEQVGRTSGYRVAEGSAPDIALYMMNYHPTVWERWSSRLADIFITYSDAEQVGDVSRK